MSGKPAQICTLKKGKFVGGQAGFADTFNWVASCAANVTGGRGCAVKNVEAGHPEVDVQIQPGDGVNVQCGGPGQPYYISLVEPPNQGAAAVIVEGTDETTATPDEEEGKLVVQAMDGCNLQVTCEDNIVRIGVFYV